MNQPSNSSDDKPSLKQVITSVLAAGFGVQSSKNQERDFKNGRARTFIIAGVIFTIVFVITVFTIVSTVLKGTGVSH